MLEWRFTADNVVLRTVGEKSDGLTLGEMLSLYAFSLQ